jgi:hypothetical protein
MEIKQSIKAFWGRKNVTDMPTEISDFLIKVPNTDLEFALKCIDDRGDSLKELQAKLMPILQLRGAPNIPVIVALNYDNENIAVGILVSWKFGAPSIERNITFIPLIDENRARIYDEIKSSDETIRMLETSNCKIVKHIKLSEEYKHNFFNAEIVYLRDLSITYRMKSRDELNDVERLNYYLKGIPEDDYPYDKFDDGIMQAVGDGGYKNAKMNSQLMLFSSELRDLKMVYGNKQSQPVQFLVLPDYSSFSLMRGRTFKPFLLDMFVDSVNAYTFQQRHFTINIPISKVDDYYDFMDGVKTVSSITRFLKKKI